MSRHETERGAMARGAAGLVSARRFGTAIGALVILMVPALGKAFETGVYKAPQAVPKGNAYTYEGTKYVFHDCVLIDKDGDGDKETDLCRYFAKTKQGYIDQENRIIRYDWWGWGILKKHGERGNNIDNYVIVDRDRDGVFDTRYHRGEPFPISGIRAGERPAVQNAKGEKGKETLAGHGYERGVDAINRGDYQAAIQHFSDAIDSGKLSKDRLARAYASRGTAYHRLPARDLDRALADYDQAIALAPGYAGAYNNRCVAYEEKGELDRALSDCNRAIELDPEFPSLYHNRCNVYRRKRAFDRALADCNRALEMDPKSARAYNDRGIVYRQKGEFERALNDFNHALELGAKLTAAERATVYNNRGNVHRDKNEIERALADYNRALELNPEYALPYGNRGLLYFVQGEFSAAVDAFEHSTQLAETNREWPLWWFISNSRLGEDSRKELAKQLVEWEPEKLPASAAALYLGKTTPGDVIMAARGGDPDLHEERLCGAYFYVAEYYLLKGDLARAREYFRKSVDTGLDYLFSYVGAKAELERLAGEGEGRGRSAAEARAIGAGQVLQDCDECPEMVVIPAGSFVMGAGKTDQRRVSTETPAHRVVIGAPFALGKHEVTTGEYGAFVTDSGYAVKGKCGYWAGDARVADQSTTWSNPRFVLRSVPERHPVVCVSWRDAKAYVAWLSEKTGHDYRIPGEAEWEYAARGGTTGSLYWTGAEEGDEICEHANVYDKAGANSNQFIFANVGCWDNWPHTAPVGSYPPNPFGLYDMIGNASEWVADCWHEDYRGAPTDGRPWLTRDCSKRVVRGGSWTDQYLGVSLRHGAAANERFNGRGFRVARSLHSAPGLAPEMSAPSAPRFDVVDVEPWDVLNVRKAPGASSPKVGELAPDATGVQGTGRTKVVGSTTWYEIRADGMTGWVSGSFLRERH